MHETKDSQAGRAGQEKQTGRWTCGKKSKSDTRQQKKKGRYDVRSHRRGEGGDSILPKGGGGSSKKDHSIRIWDLGTELGQGATKHRAGKPNVKRRGPKKSKQIAICGPRATHGEIEKNSVESHKKRPVKARDNTKSGERIGARVNKKKKKRLLWVTSS